MDDLDVAHAESLRAGAPGIRVPAPIGSHVGSVAPEHGAAHRRPQPGLWRARKPARREETPVVDTASLAAQLKELNRKARSRNLRFEFSRSPEEITVNVIDARTGGVLRTIPAASLAQFQDHARIAVGLVIDTRL